MKLLVFAGGVAALALCAAASVTAQPRAATTPLVPVEAMPQDLPGAATTERLCSQCHTVASATQVRRTQEEWNAVIGRMIEQGLVASNEELLEVSDYLTANYGPETPSS
jgi:hypothetical protein